MRENLEFEHTYFYNTLKSGIGLPVILKSGEEMVEIHAKIDTGSSHCIFERQHGELLNVEIETGRPSVIGTATGSFRGAWTPGSALRKRNLSRIGLHPGGARS